MLPFFSYDFYTFEVRSATAQSSNPNFDSTKQFEIEATPQFLQYMKTQCLQVDLIDESVDMTEPGMRDYIGSVRIPLREVVTKTVVAGDFAVMDENRRQTGDLRLKIQMYDAQSYDASLLQDQIGQTAKIAMEVNKRIVKHLCVSGFTDLDLVLDCLFIKDMTQ